MTWLRPYSTRWFEILAPQYQCARTLGTLARGGAVEVEVRPHDEELLNIRELAAGLTAYRELAKRYHRYWRRGMLRHAPSSHAPQLILERSLARIEAWRRETDPVIDELQALEEERGRLEHCRQFLEGMGRRDIDFDLTAGAGPTLAVVSAMLPLDAEFTPPVRIIQVTAELAWERCFLGLVAAADGPALGKQIQALNGRLIERPPWLKGRTPEALPQLRARMDWLDRHIVRAYGQLDDRYEDFSLPEALGEVACLEWFLEQVGTLEPAGTHFIWVTGWTSEPDTGRLTRDLAEAGVPALARFSDPPAGSQPPQLLRNPWWSRPFEIFARAMGTPAADEVDPSPLLAVVVPLLFGYMFGDVGQGLVLLAGGLVLRQRWAGAGLLVAAGASATVFGFLFGSLFSYEGLIPALLLHPLQHPLPTLLIPLAFGAALLVLGQLLEGMECLWSGRWRTWLLEDSGLLVLYLGALGSLGEPGFRYLALAGAVLFLAGNALARGRWSALVPAGGRLMEDGLRLLVNTVSFARVGAFALAHAGLSSAIMALAHSTDSVVAGGLVLVVGNVLVILLEGLAVSIQTTRLVLFEFFMRFLHGAGRPFRPLVPPPELLKRSLS